MYIVEKKAFTLAEVLITLGIIGVVAAMTIPNLMNKIQDSQRSAGLKKALNTLTNSYNQATNNNGSNYDCSYTIINIAFDGATKIAECGALWTELKSTVASVKNCEGINPIGQCLPEKGIDDSTLRAGCTSGFDKTAQKTTRAMILKDGTYLFQYLGNPIFGYDINGFKGPNKFGEDVFDFWIINNKIVPASSWFACTTGIKTFEYITGEK